MTPSTTVRRIATAGAAALGVLLTVVAIREGMQQLAARQARDALVAAASGHVTDVDAARARLDGELASAPHDADLLELRARWALRDAALTKEPQLARDAALAAARDFRAALAQRPQWPYAWSGLATALGGAGGDPAALTQAVDTALRYGRNERRVNAELADLWLTHRATVPGLERAWRRALTDAPQYWIDRADRAGRGLTACSAESLPAAARDRCVALGWLTEPASRG